ncbi:MAG: ABC transporter substrate-binding protein [Dehalococcoidales bacterium]|nr:ABC transporter substrate-binding protein [Dehalococcoidales bacterium]
MKKGVWLLVTIIMIVSLVMTSCGKDKTDTTSVTETTDSDTVKITSTEETTTDSTQTTTTSKPEVTDKTETTKPQYGGTLTLMQSLDIAGFDHALYPRGFLNNVYIVNDTLVVGDWTRGLAGTGEIDWAMGNQKRVDYTVGMLAESFEFLDPETVVFHIRQGVHYALDPTNEASKFVGGREMTAEDVLFSLNRHINSPMSYLRITQPTMPDSTTVTLQGDNDVILKSSVFDMDALWLMIGEREIWPPELIEKYGDVNEWQNQVGNGPFYMTDFVPGSLATFKRNDNYWQKDPVGEGKGNQLPYLDGINLLTVSDPSSQQAALRTGKVDQLSGINSDDASFFKKNSPELQYHKYLQGPNAISMRQDNPELPFSDIRVRHALLMAIDFDSIVNDYYSGDADLIAWPLANIKGYDKAYVPLEEMPESVQELYSYNPDKAKQLLEEAGYPDGFQTTIIVPSTPPAYVEFLSIIADMWSRVNIELNLQILEQGPYFNITMTKQYDEMLYGFYVQPGPYAQLMPFQGTNTFNRSWVNDDRVNATYAEILKYNLVDQAKVDQLHHDIMPYVFEKAWYIAGPGPYLYNFWQPWLKNYNGEGQIGYQPAWIRYVWIDKSMK